MSDKKIIKIVIAEDESLLRNHLSKLVKSIKGVLVEIVGEASNGLDAYRIIEEKIPDLILSDIKMPEGDGLSLAQKVYKNYPSIKFVILSGYDEFTYAQKALRCNVKDYLLKPIDKKLLSETIIKIANQIFSENESLVINNSTQNKNQICESIIAYIKNNYTTDISIAELSEKSGFSQEYLGKIFKKYTCETISHYIINLRIQKAKRLLLKYPDMEIYKIAELVGYKENNFYFSRLFKNKTGQQPSEYRKVYKTHA